jgi:hypothetical protein
MNTKIIKIDPKELKLLELNARFMRHEEFKRLVNNIKRDGRLTSVPFAWKCEDGRYEVLSGNHRVQASIQAGLQEIVVMVTDDALTKEERVAIQISHNAITGSDDLAMLKELYESINSVELKLYSGLDDKMLELLDQVKPLSFSEISLDFNTVTLTFLPTEVAQIKKVFEDIQKNSAPDEYWLTTFGQYDRYLDAMTKVSQSYGVTNVATVFELLLRVFENNVDQLKEGWVNTPEKESRDVPLATILGSDTIGLRLAKRMLNAVNKMKSDGALDRDKPMSDALNILLDKFEGR